MSTLPGTYTGATGSPFEFGEAVPLWARAGRVELLRVATTYHKVIEYKAFAEAIQATTDVYTRVLLSNWIGRVLEPIAEDCFARQEPLLTSLVVRAEGDVGPGYDGAIVNTYGTFGGLDREHHAAAERLKCYIRWAVVLPARPIAALTPNYLATLRRRSTRAGASSPPNLTRDVCPRCFQVKSLTGSCACD